MKPTTARAVMIVITLGVVIVGVVVVNSRFHGGFLAGVVLIVAPLLTLSFLLPHLLPVRCPRCGGKMRFHFLRPASNPGNEPSRYAYVCQRCLERHEWEGASSGSSLD